jgi:hypothetical protein
LRLAVPWRSRVDALALHRSERQIALLNAKPGRLIYRLVNRAGFVGGSNS